jgi:hypothetical protein
MLAIVVLVGGLGALFALLFFANRDDAKSAGLIKAITGTLYIGVPAIPQ